MGTNLFQHRIEFGSLKIAKKECSCRQFYEMNGCRLVVFSVCIEQGLLEAVYGATLQGLAHQVLTEEALSTTAWFAARI